MIPSAPAVEQPGTRSRWRRRRRRAGLIAGGLVVVLTVFSVGYNLATNTPAATPAGLTYLQADDVRTRVRDWAAGSGPAASPVVLVHGAAESADTWDGVARRLAATHRVVALDLTGWGYSDRVAPFDLEHQTRQLLGLLGALGLDRPVLVGHSSGAAIVAEAALRAPSRVGALVLLDGDALATGAGARSPARWLAVPPYRTTVLRLAVRSDALIRSVYGRQCGPGCPALDAAGVDAWRRPLQVAGAEDGLWGMLDAGVPGLTVARLQALAGLDLPKAVVFGALDDVFDPGTAQQTATRIGAPPPTIIPGAHHLSLVSHPTEVAAAIETVATPRR